MKTKPQVTFANGTNFPALDACVRAYESGGRFLLILKDGTWEPKPTRSAVDRARKLGVVASYFYLLPGGELRPCARGKRT